MTRRLTAFLLFIGTAVALAAQSVRWQPANPGDPSEIQLTYENCAPTEDPRLPSIDGVTFVPLGTSSTMRSVAGGISTQSTIVVYRLKRGGAVQIPAFSVGTDKGTQRVAAFTVPAPTTTTAVTANSTLTLPSNTVWAGEVFPLTYKLSVQKLQFSQLGSDVEWSATPLSAEEWSRPEPEEVNVNGQARLNLTYRTRASARTAGRVSLNPVQQLVNIQSGSMAFGLLTRLEQLSVTSTHPEIEVRPLPANAPATFNGAVGKFTLAGTAVPTKAAVGEPITWTLSLSGTGNWPDIPGMPVREVSNDFKVVQPKPRRTQAEGKLFDGSIAEDIVLVPTKPGNYTLAPVSYTCFDPASGTYRTLTTDPITVTVTGTAPVSAFTLPPPPPSETAAPTRALPTPQPAAAPEAMPNAPLDRSGSAFVPVPRRTLIAIVSAPFAALVLFWLGLAFRRAGLTDPLRTTRQAHAALAAIVEKLGNASDAGSRTRLLLDWQHQTGILYSLPHAAPPSSALKDPAWARLWSESDRALYSKDKSLPRDWTTRARAALDGCRIKPFSSFRLFLPHNLIPFLLLVAAVAVASPLGAKGAYDDYLKGDFAAAEKTWRDDVRRDPTDWVARHNLALALMQQSKAGEAAAQATAAFVQNPRNPSVRWELQPTAAKAGYMPETVQKFIPPRTLQKIAQLASPSEWQGALVLSSILASVAIGLWLARAYGWRNRWTHPVAALALLTAIALGTAGAIGLRAFGLSADPRAVVAWRAGTLRTIPTDADSTQQTVALPAGNVAVADNTYLGWTHITVSNGQAGWTKKEDLVGLWK